jgi:hypothetical protein
MLMSKRAFCEEVYSMAQSPREGQQALKEEKRPSEGGHENSSATGAPGRSGEAVQRQTERVVEVGRERIQQATEATAAAASGALRSGSAAAGDAHEITAAWTRYAEEVMRHTSEASQALLRARTFAEMLEVQAKLLRDQYAVIRRSKRKNSRSGKPDGDAPVRYPEGSERRSIPGLTSPASA